MRTAVNTVKTQALSLPKLYLDRTSFVFLGPLEKDAENEPLPKHSYMGTSQTRGNVLSSLVNLTNIGPISYSNTDDDRNNLVNQCLNVVANFPRVSKFPWNNIIENWSEDTTVSTQVSKTLGIHIYKKLGTGYGEVVYYRVADSLDSYNSSMLFPFNGKIYAGTLVQLYSSGGQVSIIPYQHGRGSPYYADHYESEDAIYPPYGPITDSESNFITPTLAPGINPADNTYCVGVVLEDQDTNLYNSYNSYVYNYDFRTVNEEFELKHQAPFTSPPKSLDDGYLSPGPNTSGCYWSPWPSDYTFKSGQPAPVLTRGVTTLRIGACYNVALQSYSVQGVPMYSIPLFEGESLEAGSYVYASVKGHEVTLGPKMSEYYNKPFTNDIYFGPTVWDPWIDSTGGNIGWTSTPGLSFYNIPDSGVLIPETLNGYTIPILHQACQGSVIVHPVTVTGLSPTVGANLYGCSVNNEIANSNPEPDVITNEDLSVNLARRNVRGISGRCNLPQTVPEKAVPIGVLLETIRGTGKWPYSGLITNPLEILEYSFQLGGSNYQVVDDTEPPVITISTRISYTTITTGLKVGWNSFNGESPYLGTVTSNPIETAGTGPFTEGDLYTISNNDITDVEYTTPFWKMNNCLIKYGSPCTLISTGSNYTTGIKQTHNLTDNSLYYFAHTNGSGEVTANGIPPVGITFLENDYDDQQIRLLEDGVPLINQAIIRVDGTTPTIEEKGTGYDKKKDKLLLESQKLQNVPPMVNITSLTTYDGVSTLEFYDYGVGNNPGDKIIIIDGDKNLIMTMPSLPFGQQEIVLGSSAYVLGDTYNVYYNGAADPNLTVTIRAVNEKTDTYGVPVMVSIDSTIAPTNGAIYELVSSYNYVPNTWYHGRHCCVQYSNTPDLIVHRGGTGYTDDTNVTCYNLTANSLRLQYDVVDGILTNYVPLTFTGEFYYNQNRYPATVTILDNDNNGVQQEVNFDNGEITVVTDGYGYSVPDGTYVFQTQRTNQENPIVDIITDGAGRVRQVKLKDIGTNNEEGDYILILAGDQNCVFKFSNNLPIYDFPPYVTVDGGLVLNDNEAWERYIHTMESTTNLFDRQVLVELRPGMHPNQLENIYPAATALGDDIPSTTKPY